MDIQLCEYSPPRWPLGAGFRGDCSRLSTGRIKMHRAMTWLILRGWGAVLGPDTKVYRSELRPRDSWTPQISTSLLSRHRLLDQERRWWPFQVVTLLAHLCIL